jgi:hypothetical protein
LSNVHILIEDVHFNSTLKSLMVADNVSYYYLDSGGAVSGNTRTTLVFIHGMGYSLSSIHHELLSRCCMISA